MLIGYARVSTPEQSLDLPWNVPRPAWPPPTSGAESGAGGGG
jgi:hypothetical protein